ncbi:hypothetical protein HKX48_007748 [Thoreauomyces humboldtii]|nr:hypothetical protein HKX48_007748 [Thoreauomyces humboldtii]
MPAPALGTHPQPAIPTGSAQSDPGVVHVQLIPHSDVPDRPAIGNVVERAFTEGMTIRIGRQVVKDGVVVEGKKAAKERDVWFESKVVSRNHAEMWVKDGQIYIKDIGSSSGTFLNKMRLSPSTKESRPYPLKEGDLIQLGIDYKGKTEAIYKSIMVRIGFYDQSWVNQQRRKANPVRFRTALRMLLAAANPFATSSAGGGTVNPEDDSSGTVDCCICIGAIGPFQALFVAPCSHCYHYKCVHSILAQSAMFQCPMCRQVANLAASVSTDDLFGDNEDDDDNSEETTEVVGSGGGGVVAPVQPLRIMGQLRGGGGGGGGGEDGDEGPDSAEDAPSTPVNVVARLGLSSGGGGGGPKSSSSGVSTPRNTDAQPLIAHASASASAGNHPATATAQSPESNTTISFRSPVDRLAQVESVPASGTSTGTSTPTVSRKRRSDQSLTAKLNVLLRRAKGEGGGGEPQSPGSGGGGSGRGQERDEDEEGEEEGRLGLSPVRAGTVDAGSRSVGDSDERAGRG